MNHQIFKKMYNSMILAEVANFYRIQIFDD